MPRYKTTNKILKDVQTAFSTSNSDLKVMIRNFHDEMRHGLAGEPRSLKMLPSYIDCPEGNERGTYLGLDLGGTNFRVLKVQLKGGGKAEVNRVETYKIPQKVTQGKGRELFDFIAGSISGFVEAESYGEREVPLGFTFSFPVKQKGVVQGQLISWTKEFRATDVVNSDVVQFLKEALFRKEVKKLLVKALINDAVGTLLAKSYETDDSDIGVIFGTGTNGCYREQESAISLLPKPSKMKKMIVNTEWGNFNLFPGNRYDQELDRRSKNPGSQLFEKKISGMYLGELTRLVLKDLIDQGTILSFTGKFRKGSLTTRDMATFERDRTEDLSDVKLYLDALGMESTLEDRVIIRQVCRFVSCRAARISSAAISSIVTWIDPELHEIHTVAIDGSVYSNYPGFKRNIIATLEQLHGEMNSKIKLSKVKDGSGIGAAIAAAVASPSNL